MAYLATQSAAKSVPANHGNDANPAALSAIVKAGETYSIVASQDIVDVRGLKLLAKGQPVSGTLQQRLLERKLLQPLEACLQAEDGVTTFTLHNELSVFLDGSSTLAIALRPWAAVLLRQAQNLPLHSVAQLLLTTALANRPHTLTHAVQAMALAGAMACREGSFMDIRLAMLGGLLHDIGETYIQPQYLDYAKPLDLVGHTHIITHPRVAHLLLRTTTDYPESLCRAIGEHHERMDGSGYPARLVGEKISTLGRLLAVVEVTMGIMRAPVAPLTRASFALRVVPGEFDSKWVGLVCELARDACEPLQGACANSRTPSALNLPLDEIDKHAQRANDLEAKLKEQQRSGAILEIVSMARNRLARLRVAWNALGLWGLDPTELSELEWFDAEMAANELKQHLRELQRECLLQSQRLGVVEKVVLQPLWQDLLLCA